MNPVTNALFANLLPGNHSSKEYQIHRCGNIHWMRLRQNTKLKFMSDSDSISFSFKVIMIETVIQIIFVPLADDLLAPMMNISRIGFMVCWIGYTRIMFESITLIIISLIMIKIYYYQIAWEL